MKQAPSTRARNAVRFAVLGLSPDGPQEQRREPTKDDVIAAAKSKWPDDVDVLTTGELVAKFLLVQPNLGIHSANELLIYYGFKHRTKSPRAKRVARTIYVWLCDDPTHEHRTPEVAERCIDKTRRSNGA